MTQREMIEVLSGRTGRSKREIKEVIEEYNALVKDSIIRDGGLWIKGFGTFKLVKRNARKCRNPKTGEMIEIGERYSVRFKPSCAMLRVLSQ